MGSSFNQCMVFLTMRHYSQHWSDFLNVVSRAMEPCIALGLFLEVAKHWALGTAVVVLDAPLLFEAKLDKFTQPIVVVWVDHRTQEARLMNRDRISIEQANNRINAQLSLDVKRERADIVIDNSGSLEATKLKVAELKKEISGPPTWKELAFSRFGVAGIVVGFLTLVSRLRWLCQWSYSISILWFYDLQ